MKKHVFWLAGTLLILTSAVFSQDYTTGAGIRFGNPYGVTVKHFISTDEAIEGILSTLELKKGVHITVLYEKYSGASLSNDFALFYGIGGHAGYYKKGFYEPVYYNGGNRYTNSAFTTIGIDGIVGIEFTVPGSPIAISADLKPVLEYPYPTIGVVDGGITFRYVF